LWVETVADVVGCWGCGTRAVGHGRSVTLVRDLPMAGRPTVLVWSKRRWRCSDPDGEVNTWSETTPQIVPRAVLTERARRRLAGMVNTDGDSIAGAAAAFGVGGHAASRAVADHTDSRIDDPGRLQRVEAIGVDEKRFGNATPTCRPRYFTQIVDLDRHRVLDVIAGRSRDVLGNWLRLRGSVGSGGKTGATGSVSPPWIRLPDTAKPSKTIFLGPPWSSTTSTRSASPTRRSTTSAAASNSTPSDIGAANTTPSTVFGGYCSPPTNGSAKNASDG
jgi:hypothetical protein